MSVVVASPHDWPAATGILALREPSSLGQVGDPRIRSEHSRFARREVPTYVCIIAVIAIKVRRYA